MKGSFVIPLLGGIFFLIVGIASLFWPGRVMKLDLRWSNRGLGKYWPIQPPPITPARVLGIRVVGAVIIVLFFLTLFAVIRYRK